jgi:hypothetical protein
VPGAWCWTLLSAARCRINRCTRNGGEGAIPFAMNICAASVAPVIGATLISLPGRLHGDDQVRQRKRAPVDAEVACQAVQPEVSFVDDAKDLLKEQRLSEIDLASIEKDSRGSARSARRDGTDLGETAQILTQQASLG